MLLSQGAHKCMFFIPYATYGILEWAADQTLHAFVINDFGIVETLAISPK